MFVQIFVYLGPEGLSSFSFILSACPVLIILIALAEFHRSCKLIIHYPLPLNNHFIETVILHTSCAPGMVNKIWTPPLLENCSKLH